jgi:RNA polymerase sigma-70 factor, ECF subfamily
MHTDTARIDRAISAMKAGDTSALDYLYVTYADEVCAYVRTIVRSHHDAEDITQNVFLKLPNAIRRYESRGLPFERWLMRVARNASLDHLRARRQVPYAEVYVSEEGYEESEFDLRHTLEDALAKLPADQREVVVLRHALGLSPPEIAKRLSRTEASVNGLHHRGRRSLITALEEVGTRPAAMAMAG